MYASVRGWLEIDFEQESAAREIIQRHHHELYSGGWAFPAAPFNWTLYLFYGGDVQETWVPWLRGVIGNLAAMPPRDDDGHRPVGLFLITDERGNADVWQVRDGALTERPAPSPAWPGE